MSVLFNRGESGAFIVSFLRVPRAAVVALLINPCLTWSAWAAGGAYAVDDSEIGEAGTCAVDTWASVSDDGNRVLVAAPACVFEFLPMVEWELQAQHHRQSGESGNHLGGQTKIALVPIDDFGVGIALVAGAGHSLRDDHVSDIFVNVPFTLEPIESLRLNLNIGWRSDEIVERDFLSWGAGLAWTATPTLTIIAEYFGENEGIPAWQAGPRLTVLDGALDLDLVAGQNITGVRANWLTLGVTAHF